MKKISENRTGFSKRMLSILLVIVLSVSNTGVGSVAAQTDTEGTESAVVTEPAEAPTEESKPESSEADKPEESRPESSEESKPESTEPSNTESTEASKPESTEPSGTESTEGASTEPSNTEVSNTESTEPSGTESTEVSNTESTEELNTESTEELVKELPETLIEEAIERTAEDTPTSDSTIIPFDGYKGNPLDIYNYLYYTDASGKVQKSGGSYKIHGENSSQSIIIGNHPNGDDKTDPMEEDILISLGATNDNKTDGLNMTKSIIIHPVGTKITETTGTTDTGNKVVLTVDAESSLGDLVVEENASLQLILKADLTVASISLGKNSRIEVFGDSKSSEESGESADEHHNLTVSGGFSGEGTVVLEGGIIKAQQGISAAHLSLKKTTVAAAADEASEKSPITATETLSMEDSTVENASLFGYVPEKVPEGEEEKQGIGEKRTLIFTGTTNHFSNVDVVGCAEDSNIRISIQDEEPSTINFGEGVSYYCDYSITYHIEDRIWPTEDGSMDDTAIKDWLVDKWPVKDWPVAYRVKYTSNNSDSAEIQGYHTSSLVYQGITESGERQILLPEIKKPGYEYTGWKNMEDSDEPEVEAFQSLTGDQKDIRLSAALKAKKVTIKLDRGYEPDQYTNDEENGKLPPREESLESEVNGNVILPAPFRFGYEFKGWKIVTEGGSQTIPYEGEKEEFSYQVLLKDCTVEGDDYIVTMKALWEKDQFGLTLFLGTDVKDVDKLMISVDGGDTFVNFSDLKSAGEPGLTINKEERAIRFPANSITYGEQLKVCLKKYFPEMPEGDLPILKDESAAGDSQTFVGWSNVSGAIDGNSQFLYGEGGMLAPGKITLKEYQKSLRENYAAVNAAWGVMCYGLNLIVPENTMPKGWSLTYMDAKGVKNTVNAGEKDLPSNGYMVQQDSTVTFTTTKPFQNFSWWGFLKETSTDRKIFPVEQPYKESHNKLTYTFKMPAANVDATYSKGQEVWIDIARSPIEFEKNVTVPSGRKCSGFWYADTIDELTPLFRNEEKTLNGTNRDGKTLGAGTYFYQWDFEDTGDKLCVTSYGRATKNQLKLVDALAGGVYFKNVHLEMQDAYKNSAVGSLIGGVDCEITNDGPIEAGKIEEIQLTKYANIIIDNGSRKSYETTLHFVEENNTVGTIMPDTLRANNNYQNTLKILGEGKDCSSLKLGSAFGNFVYTIKNIKINEYLKDDNTKIFKYLIHSSNWSCSITDAVIEAEHKTLHVGNYSFYFTRSNVDLYSINSYSGATVEESYLRIRENLLLGYVPLSLKKDSKVVIDGNLEMNYQHWNTKGDITDGTSGNWLVVKGNRCDLTNFNWSSGTLICNALIFGRCGGVSGGTVIANQILSQPVGFWKYNKETHQYNHAAPNDNNAEKALANEDDYPFPVLSQKRDGIDTYGFKGGKTYLLGYYELTEDGTYNPAVKAWDDENNENNKNPVKDFMLGLFDSEGDLIANPSVKTENVEEAVKASTEKDRECIVLGNSTYNNGVRIRSIEISGNAEVYAAGNITFFNDTTVTGGKVYCNGSFGTKGDLTIKDGRIEADTVGNAYNLKNTLKDGTTRWKRTDIQGGTVNAKQIGAFSKKVSDQGPEITPPQPRSTVTIGEKATIEGTPAIVHDVYINYIYGKDIFTSEGNPESLRFETNWKSDSDFAGQDWENKVTNFNPPAVSNSQEDGNWKWDSLTGKKVDNITGVGIPRMGKNPLEGVTNAYNRIQMKLYAVKEKYHLVFMEGATEIESVTCDGKPIVNPTKDKDKREVDPEKRIVLAFKDSEMAKHYNVLWYVDGNGIIHSVDSELVNDSENNKRSFIMPSADVEVYATKTMHLDLDNASYTLEADGFRTESSEIPERGNDSWFHYWGDLVIEQGSIEKMTAKTTAGSEYYQIIDVKSKKGTGEENISTLHDIRVKNGFDNMTTVGSTNPAKDRRVTLHHIYQLGESYSIGIYLEEGAKADFTLDGLIRICRVHVPEGADFGLNGKNGAEKDAFYPYVIGQENTSNRVCVGNFNENEKAGNITLTDLTLIGKANGLEHGFCRGKVKGDNTVTFRKCKYQTSKHWYSGSNFASNAGKVIFDNSEFTITRADNWPSPFFENCDKVSITNGSKITVKDSGSSSAATKPFYSGIKEELVIDDAEVNLFMRVTQENKYLMFQDVNDIAPVVKLENNASLTLDQHARLISLVLGGTSTVNAGGDGKGYLLCPDIEVNNQAKLNAGGIIVSGFYDASHAVDKNNNNAPKPTDELQKEENFRSAMAANKYIYDGEDSKGLVVDGGTVTATEYITGDVNGKVTVNGGSVSAPAIGTTGSLYGYTRYVPRENEKYIYTYNRIPVGMKVTIAGGEVHVDENLGGILAEVSISGGKVDLGEDAVLGLTEAQQMTLTNYCSANNKELKDFVSPLSVTGGSVEGSMDLNAGKGGSIRMPYGKVDVSGKNTGINVYNMTAPYGEITISGLTGKKYENPYEGKDRIPDQENVGLLVANHLSALNLTITKGSVVYAKRAYADVPKGEKGQLTVTTEETERGYLYADDGYGAVGEGESSYVYNDGLKEGDAPKDKNVFGHKLVGVKYILHPEDKGITDAFYDRDLGKEKNPNLSENEGLPYYVSKEYASKEERSYKLQDASCSGYKFLGWYRYDPVNKEFIDDTKVEAIDKTVYDDVFLGAKWERVKVDFEIRIETTPNEFNKDTMEAVEGEEGLYRFKETIEGIKYGEQIFTTDGYQKGNYTTNSLGILEIYYNETKITDTFTVTAEMADTFVKGIDGKIVPLVLKVTATQSVRTLITLDQNKNEKNRPRNTKFNLSTGKINSGSDITSTVSAYADDEKTLASISPFISGNELIKPTAPGYTFGGWYTDKKCTKRNEVTADTKVKDIKATTTLYAKWTPNTYLVQFNAATEADESYEETRWVTSISDFNDEIENSMNYCWIYDTAPGNDKNSFWISDSDSSEKYMKELPKAWREGYVFEGWKCIGADQKEFFVSDTSELNEIVMKNLNVENYVGKEGSGEQTPALILYASYHKVTVKYGLEGGKWTVSTEPSEHPRYGDALAGYKKEGEVDQKINETDDYIKRGGVEGADKTKYCVLSTTSGYFERNFKDTDKFSGYVPGDYRQTLMRKGYTFYGWKNAEDDTDKDYYGCTPRFKDISLKAEWKPNVYNLKLHVKDEDYSQYESAFSSPDPSVVDIENVTVGEEILTDQWPDKKEWYAYNKDEKDNGDKHRLLLGATFAGLDPGDSDNTNPGSIYLRYAEAVTNMLNSKTMFDNGDTFTMPEDETYKEDLAGAVVTRDKMSSVPDYPTGSVIPMYGVYRERSLVFIEEYVDEEGITQERIMYSHPWREYTRYPFDTYPKDPKGHYAALTGEGYNLAGWFVGSSTIDSARKYPENEKTFFEKIDEWKKHALKETDINIYTAYVAQKTYRDTLKAIADPTKKAQFSQSHTLPGSMQEGRLSYQLTGMKKDLKLVTREEMEKHQYDSKWGRHTADNTVAIELKLTKGGKSYTVDLKEAIGKQPLGGSSGSNEYQSIGKDWILTLTLYHSKVMTKESSYSFCINYDFEKYENGTNVLEGQWLKQEVTVELTPSLYDVEYQLHLPEGKDLTQTQTGPVFAKMENTDKYHCTVKQGYGSKLLSVEDSPVVEGYERDESWSYNHGKEIASLTILALDDVSGLSDKAKEQELQDGRIMVYARYTVGKYMLKVDENALEEIWDRWTIAYGDGANDKNKPKRLSKKESEAKVKYLSQVTFDPADDKNLLELTLTFKNKKGDVEIKRLDKYAEKQENGTYIFDMPAQDVIVSTAWELYLDYGTIELFPDGFEQKPKYKNKIDWKGDYRILQCEDNNSDFHETRNVLKLHDDLIKRQDDETIDRSISLGKLNITSENSIELIKENSAGKGAVACLTQKDAILAKNILVPMGTSLTMKGTGEKGQFDKEKRMILAPDLNRAAIGAAADSPANGTITLKDADVFMELKGSSVSSGIGPGKQDSTVGSGESVSQMPVTVTDSRITVKESQGVPGQYTHAWVGGAGVPEVNITGTSLLEGSGSDYGAYAVNGITVNLTDCNIGEEGTPVKGAIHGGNNLRITRCQVY